MKLTPEKAPPRIASAPDSNVWAGGWYRYQLRATDPEKADKGSIRADFADSIDANAVHGSDAAETAAVEIAYFFPALNIYSR